MNEPIYYDTETEEYITESDLFEEYESYLDNPESENISFAQFINNCLTINNGIEVKDNEPMNDTPLNYILKTLKENNKPFWDYPLDFYNNLQNQEPDIVLVNCSYYNGEKFIQEYRWFEV